MVDKKRATKNLAMTLGALAMIAGVTWLFISESNAVSGRAEGDPIDFSLVKIRGRAVYGQTGKDRCDFEGWIKNLPAGWNPEGAVLDFHIAGAWIQVTLDENGRNDPTKDAGGENKFRLKFNFQNEFPGGNVYFKLKSGGTWQPDWTDDGITPDREAKNETINMSADFQLDSNPRTFLDIAPILTSIPNKAATFILIVR